ncbi:O-antigen ligase family protein [Petrocella sp. FN5]|uniref:O-antigen ligase family protein n=1 Tax=Petrocella sp. FN5 TaxID=3032002 RepID=UPI0023DCA719|nr:O-antigen ligase family protein [Petrocella sp. FN5]MDF1618235.1 O-antigen ligase family protein [Petrocella sp. FN5]
MFLQGLYFNHALMLANVVMIVLMLVGLYHRGSITVPKDVTIKFLLLFLAIQILALFTAVEKGMQVYGIFLGLLLIMAYIVIYQVHDELFMKSFKWVFVMGVILGGLIGIASYLGLGENRLSYVIHQRMAGPIQYANTWAIVVLAAILVFLTLAMKPWQKVIGMSILGTTLLMTMSRSVTLIACLVMVYLIFRKKLQYTFWIGLGLSVIINRVLIAFTNLELVFSRLTQMTPKVSEWQTRLLYYDDALHMIGDRPLGYGTFGYYYAQRAYQTGSMYHVRYVHSSLLQAFLDIGMIGGMTLAAFMIYIIFIKKYDGMNKLVIMVLLFHSLTDINLQFPYIWLLILIFSMHKEEAEKKEYTLPKNLSYFVLFILLLPCIYFLRVETTYQMGDYEKTLNLYQSHTEGARRYLQEVDNKEQRFTISQNLIHKNPYIIEGYQVQKEIAIKNGNYPLAVEYAKILVALNPLNINRHEDYSTTMLMAGEASIRCGDVLQGKNYLEAIRAIPEGLVILAKEKNTHYNIKHKPHLVMTEKLNQDYEKASELLMGLE